MTDKYDLSGIDSLPAAPAAPASAKYDLGAIDAIPEATGFDKSAALFTAAFGNPSEEAQKRRLSSDITRIVGAYEPVLDVKEGMRRHQQLEADHATRASPRTSAFLSVPENAAVAIQDAKTMAQIEAIIGGDPARALEITAKRLAMAPANLGAWGFDVAAVVPDIAGEGLAAVGLPNEYNVFRDMASGSRRHATAARAAVDYFTPEARNLVERAAASAGTSAGTSLQLLPLAMSGAGAPMAAAFGLGTFGESYTKARDQGKNPIQALQYAIPQGAYEALFEMAPAAFLADALKTAPGLKQFVAGLAAREVPTEMATTVAQNLNDWVTFNPNKSVADFIAEQPEALAETIIATVVGAGVQAGIIHGAQRTTGQFQQMQEERRAKQLQETLTGLMDQAKNVKSDPVTFQNFMAGVTDHATVFINADALQDTLAQNKMDVSVLPSLAEQLAQPSVTGDVEVPIGELMTAFAGTPAQEQVVQHARVRQDDLSAAEQAQFGDMGAFFKKQGEAVMEKQKANESFVSERQEIEADIVQQLGAASPFQEREHRYYAQMMGAFYSTAADLMGTTPKQIQARWAPKILGATEAAQPGTLTQGFDHGNAMLNVGLDVGATDRAQKIDADFVKAEIEKMGVQVLSAEQVEGEYEYEGKPVKELTYVPQLSRPLTEAEVNQLAIATGQEAIGHYADGTGNLWGPNAANWGDFNPEFFKDQKGTKLSDAGKGPWRVWEDNIPEDRVSAQMSARKMPGYEFRAVPSEFHANGSFQIEGRKVGGELAQSQSTRRPTTKKAAEDHLGEVSLVVDYTKIEPEKTEQNMKLVSQYPGIRFKARKADGRAEEFIQHVTNNLLWLHDQIPAEIRQRSKRWYDGARAITDRWVEKYGKTDAQIAAILAVYSPQKDWFMNVSLAERTLDIVANQQDTAWSPEMTEVADKILADEKFSMLRGAIEGKKLSELKDRLEQAAWLRTFDEAHNNRGHRLVTPEGGFLEFATSTKNVEKKTGWPGFGTIIKALYVIDDGSPKMIDNALGGEHKVRSFYNNIFHPTSDLGFVTIDTHAVAAGLLRPLSGNSVEVTHNFGGAGTATSAATGMSGTYAYYQEAYRRAAEARGLLPREMQSITWEAVRELYTMGFKHDTAKMAVVDKLWSEYEKGKRDLDSVRAGILNLAGGVEQPSWVDRDSGISPEGWASTYTRELLGDSVPRRDTGMEPGAGERAAAGTAGANLARKLTDHEAAVAEYNGLNNTELGLTTEGGRVLNTDLARELSPEYRARRSISQAVHEPASAFIKKLYAEKLAAPTPEGLQPIVVFTAGGTGAGKSSGLKHLGRLGDTAEIIYDTNMNTLSSATKKIEQALAAGRGVTINYTYRDPVEALTGGALPRAMRMGRTVPLAEHVKTHVGSREVIAQLEEKYQSDDRVTFVHVDNSNGRGKAKVAPLAEIPEVVYASLQENLNEALDEEHQAGRISDEVRAAFQESATAVRADDGAGDRGQPQPRGAGGDLAQFTRNVGAVAGPVVGIHFSKAERPALASSAWGTGMRGAEGDYVRASADKRLRHRITFYVNTGNGIKPESDVGTHAHAATLRNLYDVDADALKIWKNNQDERARESAVLDAGFDGYLSRNFGTQGAVVMLGERSQNVEYLGNYAGSAWTLPKDLKAAAVAAAQAVHEEKAGGTSREDMRASGKVVQVNSLQDLDSTYPEAQAAALGELLKAFGQPHDAKAVAGFLKGRTGSEALQAVLAEQSAQKAVAARAEVVPSAEIPKMKQAAMAIMQNRALPNGRQSVASWKRDLERSDPDTAALIAWDKIPAGDYYKDQIAGQLWQKVGAGETADMFSEDFATKATTVEDTVVVSSKGATEVVVRGNVNSAGRQIANTVSGLRRFWDWFGNSETVTQKGAPILLYHSTAGDFNIFETMRETTNTGMFGVPFKSKRAGVFLTPDVAFAEEYSAGKAGANTMQVYARMENPADFRNGVTVQLEKDLEANGINPRAILNLQYDWEMFEDEYNGPELVAALQAAGYDGAIINEQDESGKNHSTYVAFTPEQIKSATGNQGSFNPSNADILFAEAAGPRRGSFNPLTFDLRLLADANRSTFIHEASHFFMAAYIDMASQPDAPPALKQYVEDLLGYLFKNVPGGEQVGGEGLGQRTRPGNVFGREIAPLAIKAHNSLSPEAKSRIEGWNVNWHMGQDKFLASPEGREIRKAFAPVRAKLREIYGDTVPAYRGEYGGDKNAETAAGRSLFSWTPIQDLALKFAINRGWGMPKEITQEAVAEAVADYRRAGFVKFNGITYKKSVAEGLEHDSRFADYFLMYDNRGQLITDGTDLDEALQAERDEREEYRARLRSAGRLYSAGIPVDSIFWVPVGVNLKNPEFIAEYDPRTMPSETVLFQEVGAGETAFKRWAKVADIREHPEDNISYYEEGKGVVVRGYHGYDGARPFDEFKPLWKQHLDMPWLSIKPGGADYEYHQKAKAIPEAYYVARNEDTAESYADQYEEKGVHELWVRLENPAVAETRDEAMDRMESDPAYDGAIFYDTDSAGHFAGVVYVVRNPTQLKSVGNRGTYALDNPNILEQDGEPTQPGPLPEGRTNLERWNAMTLDQQRAYWEFFAEGWEQYAMSGKAPTKALQSAFSAFAKWMKEIYKTLKNFVTMHGTKPLDAELTQYFDRMLATDEELEAARAERGFQALFKNLAESGMSPGQFADYMALDALQKTEAEELLRSRSIRDMKWLSNAKSKAIKEIQAEADELRNLVRAGVEEELANTPIRQAERWLRKGLMVQDGEQIVATAGFKLDSDIVKTLFPQGAIDSVDLSRLKQMMASTGTQHPDDVAKLFDGFRNGEHLVRELLAMPAFKDEVSHLTDLRMLEEHGDLATPEAIEKAADEAIHNDAHLKMVATEVWALTNRTGSVAMLTKAAKAFASNLVDNTVVKKLSPVQFVNAATRAGKAAVRAMAKKDTDKAASEKRVEMVNAAAAKEAYAAEAEVRAIMTRLRKIAAYSDKHSSVTSREFGVVQAVRAILAEFSIGSHGEKATKYLKTLSEYDPTLGAVLDDTIEQLAPESKPWPELKVADLRELHAAVTGLWRVAKEVRSVELAGEKMSLDDARAQLIAKLEETGAKDRQSKAFSLTDAEIRNQDFQSYTAKAIRPENWVSMKDGLDEYGPWRRLIWNTIDRAQLDYNADKGEKLKQLKALLVPIMADMTDIQIDAPELGGSFGAGSVIGYSELLHAILHTGNTSNKTKLLLAVRSKGAQPWGSLREDGSLDSTKWDSFMKRMWAEGKITKTHMDFVQGVWDLLESLKEGAQKAHRATTGRYFEEIEAAEIVTPFGVYRGGYAPAIVDRRQVADMDIRKLQEAAEMDVVHSFDKPASGFTKSRVQNYNKALELNIAALGRHIDQVLLFSHMSGPVRNVQRVLKGKDLSNALAEADRAAMAHVLAPWLHSAATQVVTEKGKLSYENMAMFTKLRSRAGMALMFANVSNSLQQLTSFFPAMLEVGKKDLLFAAAKGWYKPREMAASIAAMSPYMKQRLDNEVHAMAEEIDQILLNPTKFEKAQDWAVAHSYFLQMAVDTVMSPIIWQAKFNEATARGAEKQEAIDLADSAVRKSQGSNRAIDIAAMEKGSPFYRMFMQFAGYFNSQINLIGEKLAREKLMPKTPAKYARIGMILAQGWWAPAITSMAIALAMRGGPDDEDGDGMWDDWLTELLLGTVKYATASIPVFGQAINATVNAFNDKPYDDRMSLSPAVGLIDASIRGGQAAVKSLEDPTKAGRAVRDLGSFLSLFGVPVTPITKAVGYATDVETGKVSPTSGADYARGIVTGVASPESKQ